MVMETATVEATGTERLPNHATLTAPGLATLTAPELRVEAQVDPRPKAGTEAIVCEAMVEDVVPLRSAPMLETRTLSRGGIELLHDDLIDPAFVSLSMESWRCTENWIKVRCEYPELSCIIEY
jgi:hypothetical protein